MNSGLRHRRCLFILLSLALPLQATAVEVDLGLGAELRSGSQRAALVDPAGVVDVWFAADWFGAGDLGIFLDAEASLVYAPLAASLAAAGRIAPSVSLRSDGPTMVLSLPLSARGGTADVTPSFGFAPEASLAFGGVDWDLHLRPYGRFSFLSAATHEAGGAVDGSLLLAPTATLNASAGAAGYLGLQSGLHLFAGLSTDVFFSASDLGTLSLWWDRSALSIDGLGSDAGLELSYQGAWAGLSLSARLPLVFGWTEAPESLSVSLGPSLLARVPLSGPWDLEVRASGTVRMAGGALSLWDLSLGASILLGLPGRDPDSP